MKKSSHLLSTVLLCSTLLTTTLPTVSVFADSSNNTQSVIDENYVQPQYVLGYSLSESQQSETKSLLGYDSSKDTSTILTMTPDVYASVMDVANDSSLQLYSSVKIKKEGNSKGVTVNIVTPSNITKVTEDMYSNAATSLGVEHATITVASPIAVTGESALAGVYYSLQENGANVSSESISVANDELSTLAEINSDNANNKDYDSDKLNAAVAEIKEQVATETNDGKDLSKSDVETIVTDTINKYELGDVLSNNNITSITNYVYNLSNTSVITDSDYVKTISNLKDDIVDSAKSTFSNIDTDSLKEQTSSIANSFMSWCKNVITWCKDNLIKPLHLS